MVILIESTFLVIRRMTVMFEMRRKEDLCVLPNSPLIVSSQAYEMPRLIKKHGTIITFKLIPSIASIASITLMLTT